MEKDFFLVRKLESARQLRGISYAELSRRTNINGKRLWYIMNCKRTMRIDEFVKLCAFFNLGLRQFMSEELLDDLRVKSTVK